ncbi:MAG: hypothetical protein AAF431_10350 [Pseudomonadota bacterium]
MRQIIVIVFVSMFLSACASHYGAVRINSSPEGAEVISDEDGTVLGITPTTAWWKNSSSNRQHMILRFKKAGYYEKVASFWLSMRHTSAEDARKSPDLVEVVLDKKGE